VSTRFVVAAKADVAARVEAVVARHVAASTTWWHDRRAEIAKIDDRALRRQARAELEQERARRRRDGTHFDTKSSVIVHHLLAELADRGWSTQRWRPIPRGQATLPGHPWGVDYSSRGVLDGRIGVQVPDDVAELLRRATWWTSKPAVERLQRLAAASTEGQLTRAERADQSRLRRQVVTTGDVIRAAADRLLQP
jgi:hypothetical protein